jgi:hypothetical protein
VQLGPRHHTPSQVGEGRAKEITEALETKYGHLITNWFWLASQWDVVFSIPGQPTPQGEQTAIEHLLEPNNIAASNFCITFAENLGGMALNNEDPCMAYNYEMTTKTICAYCKLSSVRMLITVGGPNLVLCGSIRTPTEKQTLLTSS